MTKLHSISKCGANSVKKARVIYVPSTEIKEAVSMYAFSKAGAGTSGEGGNEGEDSGKPGGGITPDPSV